MTDELFAIRGKVALVTGGTSGIGLMIARALVKRGARTYIVGRDAGQSRDIAAQLSGTGQCTGLVADLAEAQAPQQLAGQLAHEEQLHILVNNAGANETGTIDTVSVEGWDKVLNVNLRAGFFLTQQLLPKLRAAATAADPARIINIGSIGGLHIPNWDAFPYGASKAAVHHMTRALTKRLGKDHITVNAIAPGPFPSAADQYGVRCSQEKRRDLYSTRQAGRAGGHRGTGGVPRVARGGICKRHYHPAGRRLYRRTLGSPWRTSRRRRGARRMSSTRWSIVATTSLRAIPTCAASGKTRAGHLILQFFRGDGGLPRGSQPAGAYGLVSGAGGRRAMTVRSEDRGSTWTIANEDPRRPNNDVMAPRLASTASQRPIAEIGPVDFLDRNVLVSNFNHQYMPQDPLIRDYYNELRKTVEAPDRQVFFRISKDGGGSWSRSAMLPNDGFYSLAATESATVRPDGRCLLFLNGVTRQGQQSRPLVYRSMDDGTDFHFMSFVAPRGHAL